MTLALYLGTVITVVTLGVGVLGLVRISKDRPTLKSYDPAKNDDMGLSSDARMWLKTESETVSLDTLSRSERAESHMRAREHDIEERRHVTSLVTRVIGMLFQLTGIPLLTGFGTAPTPTDPSVNTMGNTAKPTLALHDVSLDNNNVEVDALHDIKAPIAATAEQHDVNDNEPQWSDDSDAESEVTSSAQSDQDGDEAQDKASALRSEIILDGLQFYTAVAQISLSTVHNVLDIGLFRATTIMLRERRKAQEDASIHAIQESYPDIMCLPPNANVRYAGPPLKKPVGVDMAEMEDMSRARIASPTTRKPVETSFLKAA